LFSTYIVKGILYTYVIIFSLTEDTLPKSSIIHTEHVLVTNMHLPQTGKS